MSEWIDQSKEDLRKEFRLFDTNNDGFIDKKELKLILQKILPKYQLPDEEIQRMIANVDRNNDGKIDYNGERIPIVPSSHRISFFFK